MEEQESLADAATRMGVHRRALEIIWNLGDPPSYDEVRRLAGDCSNKTVAVALYDVAYLMCGADHERFLYLLTALPERRYLKASYFDRWCGEKVGEDIGFEALCALSAHAPFGSASGARLLRMIRIRVMRDEDNKEGG